MMKKRTHGWFDLSAQVGGADADATLSRHFLCIQAAFDSCTEGPFSPSIDRFVFFLRVDGEVRVWNIPQISNPELNKRGKYIAVDVHVPLSAWKQSSEMLASYLSKMLPKALTDIVFYLGAANIPVNADAAQHALSKAIERYRQNLNSPDFVVEDDGTQAALRAMREHFGIENR